MRTDYGGFHGSKGGQSNTTSNEQKPNPVSGGICAKPAEGFMFKPCYFQLNYLKWQILSEIILC